MKEPLGILLGFNPFDLTYKFISFKDSQTITKDELDNYILFQTLYFSKLYTLLEFTDKKLVKSKFNLNGRVNEAHLSFGTITAGDDIRLWTHYKQDLIKVSCHNYCIAHLISSIYSLFAKEELKDADASESEKSIQTLKERIVKIENLAIPELPMEVVFEKLKCLIEPNLEDSKSYLSHTEFEQFILIGFNLAKKPPIKAYVPKGYIGQFIRKFHSLYVAGWDNSIPSKLKPFHDLVERSFTNFTRAQIVDNLKKR